MTLKELKLAIETNTLDLSNTLIFKYNNSKFLCKHYIYNICKNKNLTEMKIESLDSFGDDTDLFDSNTSNYLYVYETDELSELNNNASNLIIICKKVNKNIKFDYIEFKDVENWQLEEFIKMRLSGLSKDAVKWLCEICKYDYYRLDNECKKIEIFPESTQNIIFEQMNADNTFSDLNSLTIMNLSNAIMGKDLNNINNILSDLKNIDIEGTGLVTILLKQFKSNIEIACSNSWNDTMTCSEKQFKYLKYHPNYNYNLNQMIDIYQFLTGIDVRLKRGDLQFKLDNRPNNASFVDYIVTNVLILGN